MYPKRSFQPQPVPARFAWIATLVVGLCQFPLSSPLRESISQAWIDKLSGHPTETRTPISTLKGWPPSQLEDGTIKQDSTFTCSVAVISTDTAGREVCLEWPRSSWAHRPLPKFSIWGANKFLLVIHWAGLLVPMPLRKFFTLRGGPGSFDQPKSKNLF